MTRRFVPYNVTGELQTIYTALVVRDKTSRQIVFGGER